MNILFVLFLNCHVTIFVDHAIILGQLHKRQEAIKVNRTIEFPQSLSYNNNRTNGIKKVLLLNKDQIELLWSTDHWSRKVMKSKVKSLRREFSFFNWFLLDPDPFHFTRIRDQPNF